MSTKNKWSGAVSIIGAAYTPFGDVLTTPAIKGMTYRELLSWAALDALESAGITPKDVDSLMVSNFVAESIQSTSIHAVAAEWLGLRSKPSFKFETACASGATGLRLAGSLIASGLDNIVLLVGVEVVNSVIDDDVYKYRKQPAARIRIDPEVRVDFVRDGFDHAYVRPIAADILAGLCGFHVLAYAKKYGLTIDQVDEALCAAAINVRRNAARNPKALFRKEYKEIAQEAGFNDVMEYMKSSHNPFLSWPVRVSSVYHNVDGAAALVLCAAEEAKRFTKTPVDLMGVGIAAGSVYEADPLNLVTEQSAFKQAYTMADLDPQDIDYLALHDCLMHQYLTVTELAGYFQPGEAARAMMEGRSAFDGDKPINTHGGASSMGNSFDVSGIAEIAEAVLQMRGECGQRQMSIPPKCAVTHALGSGPTYGVTVLRRRG